MKPPPRPDLVELDSPAFVAWASHETFANHLDNAQQLATLIGALLCPDIACPQCRAIELHTRGILQRLAAMAGTIVAPIELSPENEEMHASNGKPANGTAGSSGLVSLDGATVPSSTDPEAATAADSTGAAHSSASAAVPLEAMLRLERIVLDGQDLDSERVGYAQTLPQRYELTLAGHDELMGLQQVKFFDEDQSSHKPFEGVEYFVPPPTDQLAVPANRPTRPATDAPASADSPPHECQRCGYVVKTCPPLRRASVGGSMTTWCHPSDLEPWERLRIEEIDGPGALADIAFVVFWRKYTDERGDADWDGWPFVRGGGFSPPRRVQDPDDWKATWFLFPE